MTKLQVPVYFDELPNRNRLSDIVEALGDHAIAETTFTGGRPTASVGEPTMFFVKIDDLSSVGVAVPPGGDPPSAAEAAERVMVRALSDLGYTTNDTRVDRDGIAELENDEPSDE